MASPTTSNTPSPTPSANADNTSLNNQATKYQNPVFPPAIPEVKGAREVALDNWVGGYCRNIQEHAAKGGKPVLIVMCDEHDNPTALATEIQTLSKLSSGPFAKNGVNFFVELSDSKLKEFRNRELNERNTSTGSIVVPVADALKNVNVIAADPYNTAQYSGAQELFYDRDRAMINNIAQGNKNGIVLVGAVHAQAIVNDPELNRIYDIAPVLVSRTVDRNTASTPYVQNACDWYNNPGPSWEENRIPEGVQGAYSKPEPWKLIQREFGQADQDRIASKLDPHCTNKEKLKQNLRNYDENLSTTFGNAYR